MSTIVTQRSRCQVIGLSLAASIASLLLPACGGKSHHAAPPGLNIAGEFVLWQSLGGGHATRAGVPGDYDGDLDLDLFEANYGEQPRLLLNNGQGEFTDGTDLTGIAATGLPARSLLARCAVAMDMDGDGDLDLIVGTSGVNVLLRNNGAGEFTDATDLLQVGPTGLPAVVDDTWALAAANVDGDGDLDLIVGNTGQNQLLLNDGNGEFLVGTDLAATLTAGLPAASDPTRALLATDLDGDLDIDLLVGNEGGAPIQMLVNSNGLGEFVDATNSGTQGFPLMPLQARGFVYTNVDATLGPDIVLVGRGRPRLLLNNGNLFFSDANSDWSRQPPGVTSTWRGMFPLSATNLWLVGDNGAIAFSSGTGWGSQTSGITTALHAVHGTSSSDVFAVGAGGAILHFTSAWSSQTSGVTGNLNGVFAVANNDIYAVGDLGLLIHSADGSTWSTPITNPAVPTTVPVFAGTHLRAVWAANATNLWAVGDAGTILFSSDGTTWAAQTSNTTRDLYAIFGTGTSNVFAVGQGGTVVQWNGSTWAPRNLGDGLDLLAMWGPSATDLWISGRGGTVWVSGDSGATFTRDDPGTAADLLAIGGSSTTNIYAAGSFGTIVRDTGATSTLGLPTAFLDARGVVVTDVDGDLDGDLVIACGGQNRCYVNNGSGLFTDGTATTLPVRTDDTWGLTLANFTADTLPDLFGANTGQNRLDIGQGAGGFADGTDVAGIATTGLPVWIDAHGAAVGDVTGDGVADVLVAVSGARNRLFIRQGFGFVDGTTGATTGLPASTDLSEFIALVDTDRDGDLDAVVANNGTQNRLYRNNGQGLFTDITASNLPVDTDPTMDVASGDVNADGWPDLVMGNRGAQNRVYVNDQSGGFTDATATALPVLSTPTTDVALADVDGDNDLDLLVSNAGAWVQENSNTTDTLRAVQVVAANDVWAVGDNGRVVHWNGTAWTATTAGSSAFRGLCALTASDIIAVGDGGTIRRWNGTSWLTPTSPVVTALRAVHGTGTNDLHAVGDGGVALREVGTGWTTIASQTTQNLTGVFANGSSSAVAVGASGTALSWNGAFWSPLPTGGTIAFGAVAGVNGVDTYAVGANGAILRHDGAQWSAVTSPVSNTLNGVAASGPTDVVVVGDSGRVLRETGTGFALETVPVASNLLAVDVAAPDLAVAVGAGGVVVRWSGAQNRLFLNNGAGVFADFTVARLPADADLSMDLALADVDLDGDLDVIWANARGQNRLSLNNGAGFFSDGTDLTAQAATGLENDADDSRAVAFISARGTQWDYVVANFEQQKRLHFNLGGGEFQDRTDEGQSSGFGLPADRMATRALGRGDLNGDGLVDLVYANAGGIVVLLHR